MCKGGNDVLVLYVVNVSVVWTYLRVRREVMESTKKSLRFTLKLQPKTYIFNGMAKKVLAPLILRMAKGKIERTKTSHV